MRTLLLILALVAGVVWAAQSLDTWGVHAPRPAPSLVACDPGTSYRLFADELDAIQWSMGRGDYTAVLRFLRHASVCIRGADGTVAEIGK